MTDFLSVKQLAEHLQVSDKTIYRMLWRGDLPGRRVGSQWRFSRSEVDFWLDLRLPQLAPPELREMSRAGGAGPGPLGAALAPRNALIALRSESPADLIGELVAAVDFPEPVDRTALVARITEREHASSTSTAQGVVLLHTARWEARVLQSSNLFAIGRLPAPTDFGSKDGDPADLLFLILAAGPRDHLALLAGAARMSRLPGVLPAIRAARSGPEVVHIVRRAEATLMLEKEG
ncbi:MAG TPA: helix-turn-helix domain-containing protein [Gemmatimonadales bacterium]